VISSRSVAIMLDAAQTSDPIDDRFEKDMAARLLAQFTARDYHATARTYA
jgi:hypothetical protein